MLLELTDLMIRIHSGFGVFQYITLRAVLGVLTALAISLLVGPAMIPPTESTPDRSDGAR